ncbi:unnamed protein product [Blepharisma stoltei]|uniref:DNA sliding clamp PCNA n=1 Tax=Blepharisma stoltei TaxID=1481888 RepID=A0AAU9JIR3_9CILI|nr:unnamed protein product [Blepharisma stoltei]
MFEALLGNATILKKLISAIKDLITEANLEITSEGISIKTMDSSKIALIILTLQADQFDEYHCSHPETIGISIPNLSKFLNLANNNETVTLKIEDNSNVLSLAFAGLDNKRTSEFTLNLLDIELENFGIPEQDYSVYAKVPSLEFARICRSFCPALNPISLSIDKEALNFEFVNEDIGSGVVSLRPAEIPDHKMVLRVTQPVSMDLNLKYLNHFNKASCLSEEVSISMSSDAPVMLQFKFYLGELRYFLAPGIRDEN